MARVVRLTEQQLTGLLQNILSMAFNPNKSSSTTSTKDSTDSGDSFDDTPKDTSIGKVSAKGQALLNNPTFKKKLKEISDAINIDENAIIKLMKHESGLDPTIKNSIGCVGLIQFCPDTSGGSTKTIAGKTYKLSDLQNDLDLQMNAIKEFWSVAKRSGKLKGPEDFRETLSGSWVAALQSAA